MKIGTIRRKKSPQIFENLQGFHISYLFLNKKRLSCHFLRLLHAHKLDQCRNDVCKASVLTKCVFRICIYQDKRNRIGCMSSPWLTGLIIYKLFCITVVSADKELSVNLFDCLYSLSYTLVLIAAASTPVWPTISGFAKLMMITSYLSDLIASTSFSQTSGALISGCMS